MTFTIGRASSLRPESVRRVGGDDIDVVGTVVAASDTELDARRQQLLGLLELEEETFPVTWTADSTIDGFYRVLGVNLDPLGVEGGKLARFDLSLRRVAGGYARAQFETILQHMLRTNDHAVTTPTHVVGVYNNPAGYTWADVTLQWIFGVGMAVPTATTLTTEDAGQLQVGSSNPALPRLDTWRAYIKPADYYKGSARVEVKYGGTWYPVHGRQLPLGVDGDWRISNGHERVYPTAVGGSGRFTVETWRSGNGWTGKEFWVGLYDNLGGAYTSPGPDFATGDASGFSSPVILVNTPQLVVVRVSRGPANYDFSLRAGDSWVEVTVSNLREGGIGFMQSAGVSVGEGTTAFTGGIRATVNNADGNRYMIASPRTITADTANSRLRVSVDTYTQMTWQMTADYRTSPLGGTQTDTATRDLFLGIRNESRRVIGR